MHKIVLNYKSTKVVVSDRKCIFLFPKNT